MDLPQLSWKTWWKQCSIPYPHRQYEHPFCTHSPWRIPPQFLLNNKNIHKVKIADKKCNIMHQKYKQEIFDGHRLIYLLRSSYSQLLPVKCFGHAQKLPRIHVPPFWQQLLLNFAPLNEKQKQRKKKLGSYVSSLTYSNTVYASWLCRDLP